MKPTDIVLGNFYKHPAYPTAIYKGVIAPDARTTFKIVKGENDGMTGKYVVFEPDVPANQDFWEKFSDTGTEINFDEPTESIPVHNTSAVRRELVVLDGEFSCKELAEKNGVDYPIASIFIKAKVASGELYPTRSERRAARGKETQLFSKIALTSGPEVV